MTKVEQLTAEAARLSDEQVDGLIVVARYLRSQPFPTSAPPEAIASIERGIADADAGRVTPLPLVMERLRQKIEAG